MISRLIQITAIILGSSNIANNTISVLLTTLRLRALFRTLLADTDPKQFAAGRLDLKTDEFFTLAAAFFQYITSVEYENFENAMRVGIPHPLIPDFEAKSVSPWSKQPSNGRSEEEILEPFLGPSCGQGSLKWNQTSTLG